MLEVPIADGANIFLWIVCILGGAVAALSMIDMKKASEEEQED